MTNPTAATSSPRRIPEPARRQPWASLSPREVLARHPPGKTAPLRVLELLIELYNARHTARQKTVSHKTRHERARFLRRFFRDLQDKAGFRTIPDPRNLRQKHVQAMLDVWQREQLAPATLQTYLSFLRGLAAWTDKPGSIRKPAHYGLLPAAFERHEVAQRDKSWGGNGVDVEKTIDQVVAFDARAGAMLRLMDALALRRKEAVMFRPYEHVVPFEQTGLPEADRQAEEYVRVKGKGGRLRWIPLWDEKQRAAVQQARTLAGSRDAHMGDPAHDLKRNLRRLDYVAQKFGLTRKDRGVTLHGLRHGRLQRRYEELAGVPPPVCEHPGRAAPPDDDAARRAVSALAGHGRPRAAAAYLGSVVRAPKSQA